MTIEQRKENRLIARELSQGELYHPGSGLYLTVESVRNVSLNGIGLKVNASLDQGARVRLGFKYGRTHMQMYGHVVWCVPVEDESSGDRESSSFIMGITL